MSSTTEECTSCGSILGPNEIYSHPLLRVPICSSCLKTIRLKKSTGCIWCGVTKAQEDNFIPEYVTCSLCPSKYCIYCLTRNFGEYEMSKIAFDRNSNQTAAGNGRNSHHGNPNGVNGGDAFSKSDNSSGGDGVGDGSGDGDLNQWKCLLCNPEPLLKLAIKKKWKKYRQRIRAPKNARKNLIFEDISLGREPVPIPCVNDYDDSVPFPFTYVCQPIPGNTSALKKNPNFVSCCSCVDNCRDQTRCECAKLMGGFAYDRDGILVRDKHAGIYECNDLCSCNRNRCQNRIVGRGTQVKIQVFKCAKREKGWGVKTLVDLPAGTYVTSYLGEILHESDCETRGINHGDEYLFELDAWGRSRGCHRLEALGLKGDQQARHEVLATTTPPEPSPESIVLRDGFKPSQTPESSLFTPLFPGLSLASTMTQSEISSLLGRSLFDRICQSNAVVRCGQHVILCGGKKTENDSPVVDSSTDKSKINTTPTTSTQTGRKLTLINGSGKKRKATRDAVLEEFGNFLPCEREFKRRWLEAWQEARSTIIDRVQLETDTKDNTFTIDAK